MKIAIAGDRGHTGIALGDIAKRNDCRVVGTCGGAVFRDALVFGDFRRMLETAKPDVLVVCSPLEEHAQTVSVAVSGLCHVFCEKPIATTFEGLAQIEAAAARAPGVKFAQMCGPFYDPGMWDAAALAGAIGEVRLLSAQKSYKLGRREDWFKSRATSSGIFPWVGIHAISWLWHFAGRKKFVKIAAAHSAERNRGHGDLEVSATAMFEFEGGVLATLTADYFRPENAAAGHGDDRLRVVGTGGVLDVADGKCRITTNIRDEFHSSPPPRGMFDDFLCALEGKESNAILNADVLNITRAALTAREEADGNMGNLY